MRKNYLFYFLLLVPFFPLVSKGQGRVGKNPYPDVERIEDNRKTNTPYSILFNSKASYKTTDAQMAFLKFLGLRQSVDELKLKNKDVAQDITVERYQQYFKGIKVEHGNYIATSKGNALSFINGDFYLIDINTSITPVLTEDAARAKAWEFVDGVEPNDAVKAAGELVFVENDFQPNLDGKVKLAYKFFIESRTKALTMLDVFVDAATGKILFQDSKVKTGCYNEDKVKEKKAELAATKPVGQSPTVVSPLASSRYSGDLNSMVTRLVSGSYRLESTLATELSPVHTKNINHAGVASFTLVSQFTAAMAAALEITDADNNWTAAEYNNANKDNTAFDVHWGAQRVYDYWKTRHSRNSWDNANGILNCYVHADNNYDNAFWQGGGGINSMFYGDGSNVVGGFLSLSALDVTGHEIGHGVCQATANLAYNRESGAMNEGFSDIWGAAIEHFGDPHEVDAVAKNYFEIGEEICTPLNGKPLRSMSNPNVAFSVAPDTYGGTFWVDPSTTGCPTPSNANDYCGVHTNSGVLNYWFYLTVMGGSGTNDVGNAFAVPAIGWVDAERIAFLAEQNLASTATFAACRTASINAATTLFGACSLQTEAVTRAWYAVNVGANFVPCTAQIGFKDVTVNVNENASSAACPATKTVTVRMMVEGPAPTGGNATATVTATGTATNGQDYTIGTGTATFPAGSTADQNITINLIDDGAIESTETIKLDFTVTPNGSTATKTNAYTQSTINIIDDDKVPDLGVTENNTVGPNATALNNTSPFHSINRRARTQYIISASDLLSYGVRPNVPITKLAVNVTTKNSTQAFTGYTISFANTTATSLSTAWVTTGLTQVYTGNYTTVVGANSFTLSPTFTWDGTSNLAIQVCFANGSAGTGNDGTEGYTGALSTTSTLWVDASSAGSGCTLAFNATNNTSFTPRFTFTQDVPPTAIESTVASNRNWQVASGNNSYFYSSADGQLIANVAANNNNLGCVTATVNVAGTGFAAFAPSPTATRSVKEFTITPTINGATTNYNATIFYTDAELAGKTPALLKLVKTNAATDALINGSNTVIVNPTIVTGSNFKGFTGNFTGFSRFFLIDQTVVLAANNLQLSASLQNDHVLVKWSTSSEFNTDHFVVERSYDGVNFSAIQNVPAAGISTTTKQYSLLDAAPAQKINYYRIKTVDKDGVIKISPIVVVKLGNGRDLLALSPNPVRDNFNIQYSGTVVKQITIVDMEGKKIKEYIPTNNTGSIVVDASNLASGIYLVKMLTGDNNVLTQKMVKQ